MGGSRHRPDTVACVCRVALCGGQLGDEAARRDGPALASDSSVRRFAFICPLLSWGLFLTALMRRRGVVEFDLANIARFRGGGEINRGPRDS